MTSNSSEKINEEIKVIMLFGEDNMPLWLVWRQRRIKIKKVNLKFCNKKGETYRHYFYVNDSNGNDYKLCFDAVNLSWILEEISF